MTERRPRAPELSDGTCIVTAALMESAQRVFAHHSVSPIHWLDLCTLIEAVVLHDKVSFPIVHDSYAEPMAQPLFDSGIADAWWPQAGIIQTSDESDDFNRSEDASPGTKDAESAVWIFIARPDKRYDQLTESRRRSIDGIAHGFSEAALLLHQTNEIADGHILPVLLWGGWQSRFSDDSSFESSSVSLLQSGTEDFKNLSPEKRAEFTVPHQTSRDIYNHYAKNLRDLANDAQATIVKSIVEEPFFDSPSVETAVRDTLNVILNREYEANISELVANYCTVIPASLFGGLALSSASSLNEAMKIAVDLRASFSSYRDLRRTYRIAYREFLKMKTFALARELEEIEGMFTKTTAHCFSRIQSQRYRRLAEADHAKFMETVFDGGKGLKNVLLGAVTGDFKKTFEQFSDNVVSLMKGWIFMNYGGVYQIVSKLPNVGQLSVSSERLIGKALDGDITAILTNAAQVFQAKHKLPTFRQ